MYHLQSPRSPTQKLMFTNGITYNLIVEIKAGMGRNQVSVNLYNGNNFSNKQMFAVTGTSRDTSELAAQSTHLILTKVSCLHS